MAGGLLDDPELLAGAARDAGLDPAELERLSAGEDVDDTLQADIEAARRPCPAARALDHKLGGPPEQRRDTAPSYEITRIETGASTVIPGFNPIEAYEAAIANHAPEIVRRPDPDNVTEVLAWADYPLATAEVAAIAGLEVGVARAELSEVATPIAAGAEFYWRLG
ncbi:MAG: hypothetical protein M3071_19550 [Actinomycetota bacterium]|nr:hypothetical protein [Actinomycetota bacterium]